MSDEDTREYDQRVKMNHVEQVETFGWCLCDGGHVSEGCPI